MKKINMRKDLSTILAIACTLSVFGFMLDLGERVPDPLLNVQEIVMMTAMLFPMVAILYFPIKWIRQGRNATE